MARTGTPPRAVLLNFSMSRPQASSSRVKPLLTMLQIRNQLHKEPLLRSSRPLAKFVNSNHSTQVSSCTRSRTQSSRPSRSRRAICRLPAKLPLITRTSSTNSNSRLMVMLRTFPIPTTRKTGCCSESPTTQTSASSSQT